MSRKWNGMNWIRQDKRLAIYIRDGFACMWCGESVEDGACLTLDHVRPHSKGGSNDESNLVTCCERCNKRRQDRLPLRFARIVAEYVGGALTAEAILADIRRNTRRSLAPYRALACQLIRDRGSAAQVVAHRCERHRTCTP